MNELRPEVEEPRGKRVSFPAIFAAVLLAVYFLAPVVFFRAVVAVYPGVQLPRRQQSVFNIAFFPVIKFYEGIPIYRDLVNWEAGLLGMEWRLRYLFWPQVGK